MNVKYIIPLSVLMMLTAPSCWSAAWCQSVAGQCATWVQQLTNALGGGDKRVVASILKDMPTEMKLEIAQQLDSSSLMRLAEMDPNYYQIIKTMPSFQNLQQLMRRHNGNLQAALDDTIQNNNQWAISYLIRRLNSNPQIGTKALLTAINHNRIDTLIELLKNGVNPNIPDKDGFTALWQAAYEGKDEIVQILLEYGADIDANFRLGQTALAAAAFRRLPYTVDLLIKAGADVEKAYEIVKSANDRNAIQLLYNPWSNVVLSRRFAMLRDKKN